MTILWYTYWALLIATCFSRVAFADDNFKIDGRNYTCEGNLICLGDAHTRFPESVAAGIFYGTLSLTHADTIENNGYYESAGIAYYSKPIRLLELSTRQAASFNTSFVFRETTQEINGTVYPGDGFTFLISANNSTVGSSGGALGIFDRDLQYKTAFKSIVVEFDSFWNSGPPANDIYWNHMSFDFMNISAAVTRNASDVDVEFWSVTPVYAWVEYRAETHQLEARISNDKSRPSMPFINYTVNLADFLEEYMWVGFSAANGAYYNTYYIGDWAFQAFGIPPAEPPPDSLPESKSHAYGRIGGVVVYCAGAGLFIDLLLLIAMGVFIRRKRRSSGSSRFLHPMSWHIGGGSSKSGGHDTMLQLAVRGEGYCFSYEELNAATGGFSEEAKLGQGGFGSVYRGDLHTPGSDFPIAVKKVTHESKEGEKEFMAEVSVISQLRHRNLLQLLGWCIEAGKYYIVYDLMPNGSLDKLLFASEEDNHGVLSWSQRLNIARGIAAAVDYLHQGWKQQVIHRDIKASNIMLDENWNARLGDFGLARLADHQQLPSTTINIAGTYGYMAPEIIVSRRFTEKTDVFSFGAVALEIACGRRSLEILTNPEEIILVDWVWQHLTAGDLLSVVDKRLGAYDKDEMEALLLVGLLCSHPDPSARPSMRHVVQVLLGDVPVPSVPTPKPVPMYTNLNWDTIQAQIPKRLESISLLSSIS